MVSSAGAFEEPTGIAANSLAIVVADPDADPADPNDGDGGVFYVDPETGRQFPGPRPPIGGQPLADPTGVSLPSAEDLLFTASTAGESGSGVVYALTFLVRGSPTAEPIASGENLVDPIGATQVPSGFAPEPTVVADPNAAGGGGAVIAMNPQRVWSSGGSFSDPTGVAFRSGPPSELLAVDQNAGGAGAVFSVDSVSGAQDLVSSGGSFAKPTGIASAPPLNLSMKAAVEKILRRR